MERIDTSGKAMVEHWKWAAEKGLMNPNTAGALRGACSQVLSVLDGWESTDVRTVNIDDVFRRFQNKRNKDFKPESLEAYKRRFSHAVKLFLEYADNPSSWKAPSQGRSMRREKNGGNGGERADKVPDRSPTASSAGAGLVEYPFPLREGRFAYLRLPADLKVAEVKRLTAYLNTLAIDSGAGGEEPA